MSHKVLPSSKDNTSDLRLSSQLESPSKPLKSVLVVSLFRVDERGVPPPISWRLCSRTTEISLERFDADGVASFLRECFAWKASDDASVSTLVEFLFAETEGSFSLLALLPRIKLIAILFSHPGSPFFLRSLVSSLVSLPLSRPSNFSPSLSFLSGSRRRDQLLFHRSSLEVRQLQPPQSQDSLIHWRCRRLPSKKAEESSGGGAVDFAGSSSLSCPRRSLPRSDATVFHNP